MSITRTVLGQLSGQPLRPVVIRTRLEQQGIYVSGVPGYLRTLTRRGLARRDPRYGYTITALGEQYLNDHHAASPSALADARAFL